MRGRDLAVIAMAFILTLPAVAGAVTQQGDESRTFDARIDFNAGFTAPPSSLQLAAADRLRQESPTTAIDFNRLTGTVRTLSNRFGYLTEAAVGGEPSIIAMDYLTANLDLLGLSSADVLNHEVSDSVFTAVTGASRLYLGQTVRGLSVYNALLQVNINRDGRVISVNNGFLAGIDTALNTTTAALTGTQAVASVVRHLGLDAKGTISLQPIEPALMVLPIRQGIARLVWNLQIHTADFDHIYDFTVDAVSGKVWTRGDQVANLGGPDLGSYKVYEQPIESPDHTTPLPPADARTLAVNPEETTASDDGWFFQPPGGSPIMAGNNVHACSDIVSNNSCDLPEATCAGTTCDFPLDLSMAPPTYIDAAVTNLFYWNNIIHDVQYQYGFDEVGGNFQEDNFGMGGAGSDSVNGDAQDGGGNCNANFSTPSDGGNPRMQMFTCTNSSPAQDGDFDALVIVHEYGHGISNRLVGGPGMTSCLNNNQQPGEGISDWLGLVYTAEVGDVGEDPRAVGTYLFGQPITGPGIRPDPYSTDFGINGRTYSSVAGQGVPHGVGFVWASAAWEAYWELVNEYGFDPDLYNALGDGGNQRMMLYVTEGLKNAGCSPTFLDVRDGILQAATDNHAGEDVCFLWTAFARRGQGEDATTSGPNDLSPVDGFMIPAFCSGLIFEDGFESGDTTVWDNTVG